MTHLQIIAAAVIYAAGVVVSYIVFRVLDDLEDGGQLSAWLLSVIWPVFILCAVGYLPFWLLGNGIDKIIYAVQTKILEAKCRKIREKE